MSSGKCIGHCVSGQDFSRGGKADKTRHRDTRQVTMESWHPGTTQESSYQHKGTRPMVVLEAKLQSVKQAAQLSASNWAGPRNRPEVG